MQVEIRTGFRRTARLIREDRAFRRAASRMPRPVPWEWAKTRLTPLLAQPHIDLPGEERVRTTAEPGCAIEFGIDLGGHFPIVDRIVAERWECSVEQLRDVALANLERRLAAVPPTAVQHAVMSGRAFRLLRTPLGCASSVLLVPGQLARLFGGHDQIFAAPGRHTLMSFPAASPMMGVADIVVEIEQNELAPLLLSPFGFADGEIVWEPEFDDLDEDDVG
jgi:hypothetical protein